MDSRLRYSYTYDQTCVFKDKLIPHTYLNKHSTGLIQAQRNTQILGSESSMTICSPDMQNHRHKPIQTPTQSHMPSHSLFTHTFKLIYTYSAERCTHRLYMRSLVFMYTMLSFRSRYPWATG